MSNDGTHIGDQSGTSKESTRARKFASAGGYSDDSIDHKRDRRKPRSGDKGPNAGASARGTLMGPGQELRTCYPEQAPLERRTPGC